MWHCTFMNNETTPTNDELKRRFGEELAAGIITPLVWDDETETTESEEQ